MADEIKKIKFLVADTTAFINTVQLNDYAEKILTVPDVVAEVRNKRQIRRLCVLPFDLELREPKPESVRKCVEFSKKTGDYASLSAIDIKVIALTYELEVENVGTEHLRSEPVVSKVIASKDKPVEFQDSTKLAGWYNGDGQSDEDSVDEDSVDDEIGINGEIVDNKNEEQEEEKTIDNEHQNIVDTVKDTSENKLSESHLAQIFEELNCDPDDILVPEDKGNRSNVEGDNESEGENDSVRADDVDDDDSSWITPSNIKKVKKSLEGKIEDDIIPLVACMSTDFALQNVLKQMNLNVSALNGRIIKHLRTYILRCYACFRTTSIMTKVFCPSCGNKTLKRVAVSLDENGKQVVHINTRRPLTTKYKNQSLPRFRGGKHSRNPILFEDQPIPRQMPSRVAKTKTNALDEDYIAGFSPFAMRDVDSKSAMLRSKGNIKEWARNNTFEEDRRRKHYNRLYK